MKFIDPVCKATAEYIRRMPKEQRKKYGQFFTSKETALFMAELFSIPQDHKKLTVLDPGAGSGILSAALLERIEEDASVEAAELVCYENDPNIVELLHTNLEWISTHTSKQFAYKIISDNYILSQTQDYNCMFGANSAADKYDMIIGNPPYLKIGREAPEARAMPDVCHGAPNLYFLFAAMSMFNLKDDGEMVYIIPRSWTSGAYFTQFRKHFFKKGVLEHIHLFASRDKVFDNESVLQETIIIKAKKTTRTPASITITTTRNNADFSEKTVFEAPYSAVVHGKDSYVYLVTNDRELEALTKLKNLTNTLPDIGLKMKTGLTIDFRNREALRNAAGADTVPLFYSQHIQDGKVVFPAGMEHEYLASGKTSLLQQNTNYLFVKRFTAKEERRRLQCGVYLARKHPEYKKISTQNKLNFICGTGELSECTVYGLYVLFNSSLYDCFYRILNGSTQVNSTEINTIPVPAMDTIETMGKELLKFKDMSEAACDSIIRNYL